MTSLLGFLGVASVGVAVGLLVWSQLGYASSASRRAFGRYEGRLRAEFAFLRIRRDPFRVAAAHVALVLVLVAVAAGLQSLTLLLLVPVVAVVPMTYLAARNDKRVQAISQQLDVWLLALANSLKATPSLGSALHSSASLVSAPLSEELDVMLKEVDFGAPIDRALLAMAERVDNRQMSASVSTLLVARKTGGNLPETLERTAAALREMERLEGVVRTKTAEGKAQAWVLGAMPFFMCAFLHWMDPTWLPVLTTAFVGYVVLVLATVLWLAGIAVTRKILQVDI